MSQANLSNSSPQAGGSDIFSRVSVIGLGRLGAPFALCCASRGIETIGVDKNEVRVLQLNSGDFPWYEPKAQDLLTSHRSLLHFTTQYHEAIEKTNISVILTPTPSKRSGEFSSVHVTDAISSLIDAQIEARKPIHLYIVGSTLFPGASQTEILPLFQRLEEKGLQYLYAYCPEFVALGSAIDDFLKPSFVVIGEKDSVSGEAAQAFYQQLLLKEAHIIRTNLITAELAKVFLNVFLTIKISFANLAGILCEMFPGADVDVVTHILGKDPRISPKFLKCGAPFGGTCFPRDVNAFRALMSKFNQHLPFPEAVQKVNELVLWYLVRRVVETGKRRVCVLGTSFKPGTSETTESPSHKLIDLLLAHGLQIVVSDPLALERTRNMFGDLIQYEEDPKDAINRSEVVIVMVPHKEYKKLYRAFTSQHIVFDVWRIYRGKELQCAYNGFGLGT